MAGGQLPFGMQPSGELTNRVPTLEERTVDWLRQLLFTDDREGTAKAERLLNVGRMTPPGLLMDAYDTGRMGAEGDVPGALMTAILGGFLPGKSNLKEFPLIHGSPHKFAPEGNEVYGKFRLDKLLTGEGTNYEGAGIYGTEPKAKTIGMTYANMGPDVPTFAIDGKNTDQILKELRFAEDTTADKQLDHIEAIRRIEDVLLSNAKPEQPFELDKVIPDIIDYLTKKNTSFIHEIDPVTDKVINSFEMSPDTKYLVDFLNSFKGKTAVMKEPAAHLYDFTVHDSPDNFINMHLPLPYQDDKVIQAVDNWLKEMPLTNNERMLSGSLSDRNTRDYLREKFIDDPYLVPKESMSKILQNKYAKEHMELIKSNGVLGQKWFSRYGEGSRYRDNVKELFNSLANIDSAPVPFEFGMNRLDIETEVKSLTDQLMNTPITDNNFDKLMGIQTKINILNSKLENMDSPDDIVEKLWKIYNAKDLGYNYVINDPSKTTITNRTTFPK